MADLDGIERQFHDVALPPADLVLFDRPTMKAMMLAEMDFAERADSKTGLLHMIVEVPGTGRVVYALSGPKFNWRGGCEYVGTRVA